MAYPGLRGIRRQVATLGANVSGATSVEYTLIAVMLAVAVFGSMQILREPMEAMFGQINRGFEAAR